MDQSSHKNCHLTLLNMISIAFVIMSGIVFVSLVILSTPSNPLSTMMPRHDYNCSRESSSSIDAPMKNDDDELEKVLRRASMNNKTVIIAVANKAYVEEGMLDLFLEGFWEGEDTRELVNHLILVAVDQTAYQRCIFRGLNCYRLETEGVDFMEEQVFMSTQFINMMWARTLFLIQVLNKGYNFIFTDTDVIWVRNPFTILTRTESQNMDIQFSTDFHNGNSSSIENPINSGFYYVKSNNKTISLFQKWYALKDNSTGQKEQDVLQSMISQGVLADMAIRVQFLQTHYFSGFCEDTPDIRMVVTIHANCCRFISAKIKDLTRVLHEWVQFRANNTSNQTTWSNHTECHKSWH